MDDERSCDGSTFQTVGAATWKLCQPSCVLVEGTRMSWHYAERRFARPEIVVSIILPTVAYGTRLALGESMLAQDRHRERYWDEQGEGIMSPLQAGA